MTTRLFHCVKSSLFVALRVIILVSLAFQNSAITDSKYARATSPDELKLAPLSSLQQQGTSDAALLILSEQNDTTTTNPLVSEGEVAIAAAPVEKSRTLPLYLEFTVDQPVLTVGATAGVQLTLYSEGVSDVTDLKLTLDLPNGLATVAGAKNKLVWDVPALPAGQTFVQTLTLLVDKPKQALKREVLTVVAEVSSASYDKLTVRQQLAIAPETPGESMV